jgi:hypothetical protein
MAWDALMLSLACVATAGTDLEHVLHARRLLGAETPSAVVRVECGPSRRLPPTSFALMFLFGERVWFYAPAHGTVSPAQEPGGLAAHSLDPARLLRRVDPAVLSATVVEAPPGTEAPQASSPLPNGCWIEAVSLRRTYRLCERGAESYLLSYHLAGAAARGHTVLVWQDRGVWRRADPAHPGEPARIHPRNRTPEALAAALPEVGPGRALRKAVLRHLERIPAANAPTLAAFAHPRDGRVVEPGAVEEQ